MHIAGPGGVFKTIALIKPRTAANRPKRPEMTSTLFKLLESKRAVDAGVISMATTRMIPTVCSEATMARETSSIKK